MARVKPCDQCVSATINGVFTYEFGCPNSRRMAKSMKKPNKVKSIPVAPVVVAPPPVSFDRINGFPVINTSGVTIVKQWEPPSNYMSKILGYWKDAVLETYRLCRATAPDDIEFGFIYGDEETYRLGNIFFIGPWQVARAGGKGYGLVAFRKRYTTYRRVNNGKLGAKDLMPALALLEVAKTVKETMNSW